MILLRLVFKAYIRITQTNKIKNFILKMGKKLSTQFLNLLSVV